MSDLTGKKKSVIFKNAMDVGLCTDLSPSSFLSVEESECGRERQKSRAHPSGSLSYD